MSSDIFDVEQAATYLKLNAQTVRRLARNHQVPVFKAGGTWRFRKSALDQWAKNQESSPKPKQILVIDDDQAVRNALQRLLESKRFKVTIAAGGREALQILETGRPDLVLLDLKMPDIDGVEVFREIRQRWDHLPVIILTGFPGSELMRRALEYSPVTLLSKPFPPEKLLRIIDHFFGKQ